MNTARYNNNKLERFIPISLDRLIDDLANSNRLDEDQQSLFRRFCHAYSCLIHAQSHQQSQQIKRLYQPFDPDTEALIQQLKADQAQSGQFKSDLYSLLNQANYEKLSEQDLNAALNKISPYGVKVSDDFDEFKDVALFFRGSAIKSEYHRDWKRLKLKKRRVDIQLYRRLFVLLHTRDREQWIANLSQNKKISRKKAEKIVNRSLKTLAISGDNDIIYLKLFKDIPAADLEMLFPNTQIRIRLFDKIKLALMGGGGTAGGIMATVSKLSAAIDPVSAMLAIGGLLGVVWRQIAKIFSQRTKYSAILTKNLYFYNLNNNMGALSYLADSAEREECKEAILAYFFLLSSENLQRQQLDQKIEAYIKQQYQIPMDFEIDDGLNKLRKARLLIQDNGNYCVLPLGRAHFCLVEQWQSLINPKH